MDTAKFDPALHVGYPKPLGLVHAADVALTIAAPLLTAGALSLIGVVCADADKFRWPGPTLLLLVLTVLSLIGRPTPSPWRACAARASWSAWDWCASGC
ncbi:hypothetical protein [Streptomyces mirabilis]|uniref:hypothetical protein n=1 Tax=Streptomyces mirabilis TaxID=68239 RepID=UPI0033AD3204